MLLYLFVLVGSELLEVELELLTLKDVAINTAGLTGAGRNASVETTSTELGLEALGELGAGGTRAGLGGLLDLLGGLLSTLGGRNTVVSLKVLTERVSINLNNSGFGQGVGTDKLVVGGVVDDADDTGLARDALSAPREVAGLQTEGTVLLVTATGANLVDALGTNLGHGRLATQLELPLLAVLSAHGTGVRTLVARVTADTHSRLDGLVRSVEYFSEIPSECSLSALSPMPASPLLRADHAFFM